MFLPFPLSMWGVLIRAGFAVQPGLQHAAGYLGQPAMPMRGSLPAPVRRPPLAQQLRPPGPLGGAYGQPAPGRRPPVNKKPINKRDLPGWARPLAPLPAPDIHTTPAAVVSVSGPRLPPPRRSWRKDKLSASFVSVVRADISGDPGVRDVQPPDHGGAAGRCGAAAQTGGRHSRACHAADGAAQDPAVFVQHALRAAVTTGCRRCTHVQAWTGPHMNPEPEPERYPCSGADAHLQHGSNCIRCCQHRHVSNEHP